MASSRDAPFRWYLPARFRCARCHRGLRTQSRSSCVVPLCVLEESPVGRRAAIRFLVAGSDIDVPLTGGPSGAARPSGRISSRLVPASWRLSPKFQGNPSDSRQTDGYHTFRGWSALPHVTRDAGEQRKAVHCLLPAPRKDSPLRYWGFRLLRECQAAQRCTRLGSHSAWGAGISRIRLTVKPNRAVHQRAMFLPANLSTLPKYLQGWLQF